MTDEESMEGGFAEVQTVHNPAHKVKQNPVFEDHIVESIKKLSKDQTTDNMDTQRKDMADGFILTSGRIATRERENAEIREDTFNAINQREMSRKDSIS